MKKKILDRKQETVDGVIYQYSTDWIHQLESEEHWRLYWRQAKLLHNMVRPGDRVLEIGPGAGFMANYLRSRDVTVVTMDIDPGKKPDLVANIVTVDWSRHQFDHILAFEVFEHIPFAKFSQLLPGMLAACGKTLTMSVPMNEYVLCRVEFRLPAIGRRKFEITAPKFHIDEENHFWEIGMGQTSEKKIVSMFHSHSFALVRKKRVFSRLFLQFEKIEARER